MTGEEAQSLGEIARRLEEVFARVERVTGDLPKEFVSRDLFESYKELATTRYESVRVENRDMARRITGLEDDKTWLYRLIVGAVVLALVSLAFTAARTTSKPSTPSSSHSSSSSTAARP